ncbi:MAG: hypothetical protein EBS75_07005 [Betaproteobacteria bacterium]|nr:hypothetical protein [Betaproteobacteria bacterium]
MACACSGIAAVNQSLRRSDLAAAIAWLIDQAQVDKTRLALIGWSNGGSTVLEYTHRGDPQALKGQYPGLRAAAAFYPGCITREQQGYKPAMPVLLLVGLSDDWTSPEPCLKLASPLVQLRKPSRRSSGRQCRSGQAGACGTYRFSGPGAEHERNRYLTDISLLKMSFDAQALGTKISSYH